MSKNFFRKIGYINFLSPDKERLIIFYRDLLGVEARSGSDEKSGWFGFNTVGSTFAIEPISNHAAYKLPDSPLTHNVFVQFVLDNELELEEANKYLESKKIQVITRSKKADYGIFSNFRDPDGNIVELLVPASHP